MLSIEMVYEWYSDDDPVHGVDHVLRVYQMAEQIARAEMADLAIVCAAALLHDAQGSVPGREGEDRENHHHASADFARQVLEKEGWPAERIVAVQHCIRAHRYRSTEEPRTLEAKVLFDADKLDVLGAIGVARTIAYAVQAQQPVYAQPSPLFLRSGKKEPGEPHSAYHEFIFKLRHVKERLYTATARKLAEARHAFLTAFYEQLVAEVHGER